MLTGRRLETRLQPGDSVEATGVIGRGDFGQRELKVSAIRRIPASGPAPEPALIALKRNPLERRAGQLVTFLGVVTEYRRRNGDEVLMLASAKGEPALVSVVARREMRESARLRRFGPGDMVSVTGVLRAISDSGANGGVRANMLYVRSERDVAGMGITARERRMAMLVAIGIILLTLAGVAAFRFQMRRAGRRLALAHAQLHATYAVASDAILMITDDWTVLDANEAAAALFQRPRTELIGAEALPLLSAENWFSVTTLERQLASDGVADRDLFIEVHGGPTSAAKVRFTAVDLGGSRRIVATLRDVTGEMRMEAELRGVFAAMTDIVLVFGADGEYLKVPATGSATPKWSPDMVLGRNVRDVLPAAEAEHVCEVITAALASRSPVVYDYSLPVGGETVWYNATVTRLDDRSVVWIARDITAQHHAVNALRESEARYRDLFDNNPAPMWVYDSESLRILSVNNAAVEHYGYSREEFLGKTLLDMRPAEDVPEFQRRHQDDEYVAGHRGTYRHLRKDGTVIHVEVYVNATSAISTPAGTARLVLITDVTERLRVEEQLRQSQKIEAVGLLAGGVAHDFNNILTAIQAHTDFVLDAADQSTTVHSDALEIRNAATRAANLTRQLLAFSRKQILKPAPTDVNEIVASMQTMLARLIGEDIEIVTRPGANLGTVLVDPGQFEQVLLNLSLNARDAMPKGGVLSIHTANVRLGAAEAARYPGLAPGGYVRVTVADTGVGMGPHVLAHLFEPFFTTKDAGRGTGLGLSMVHGIVAQSGGHISVSSVPNVGSTFDVFLPHAQCPELREQLKKAAPARGTETVLLVEDEEAVRAVAHRMLRRQGYRVIEASNGEEALRVAGEYPDRIHMVVTDAVMPGMAGSEVVRHLQGGRPDIRALFISGYTEDEILRRDIFTGNAALLEKPFSTEELAAAVRAVLDGASPRREPAAA